MYIYMYIYIYPRLYSLTLVGPMFVFVSQVFCADFCMSYVQTLACPMWRFKHVLRADSSISYVQISVCVLCSLQLRASGLHSEQASLRSERLSLRYVQLLVCVMCSFGEP